MARIVELLNLLPVGARFTVSDDVVISFDDAVKAGWTVEQLAEAIEAQVTGPGVRSQSAVAVSVVHRLSKQLPPPKRRAVDGVRGVGLPMPECEACGQPFGRKGGSRPPVGPANRPCSTCGEPLVWVQYDPTSYRLVGGS